MWLKGSLFFFCFLCKSMFCFVFVAFFSKTSNISSNSCSLLIPHFIWIVVPFIIYSKHLSIHPCISFPNLIPTRAGYTPDMIASSLQVWHKQAVTQMNIYSQFGLSACSGREVEQALGEHKHNSKRLQQTSRFEPRTLWLKWVQH